jgi:hypothetical protein
MLAKTELKTILTFFLAKTFVSALGAASPWITADLGTYSSALQPARYKLQHVVATLPHCYKLSITQVGENEKLIAKTHSFSLLH